MTSRWMLCVGVDFNECINDDSMLSNGFRDGLMGMLLIFASVGITKRLLRSKE